MVDPIVTPPAPDANAPAPLPNTVALNPPMVGTASPFVRVDGQNRDLILEAIRAWARGPLVDWSAGWQNALIEWLNDTSNWLESWNDEVVRYVQDVLQAVVNNSVELQDPVLEAILDDPVSLSREWLDAYHLQKTFTDLNVYTGTTFDEIQAAADAAKTTRGKVVAGGTITTDKTLIIESHADLSALVINYTGSGTAVQIGQDLGAPLQNVEITTPRILNTENVVGENWARVMGTTGLRVVNVQSSIIKITYVSQFDTGFHCDGRQGSGNSYNTYIVGGLYNNRRNELVNSDGNGWSTQNTRIGGRYGHASAEGSEVAGVEQVLIEEAPVLPRNATSGNTWVGSSVEGNVAAYQLSISGRYSQFINARMEIGGGASPRVRFYDRAEDNLILGGYDADKILVTATADSRNNRITAAREDYIVATGPRPASTIEKAAIGSLHYAIYPHGHQATQGALGEWLYSVTGRALAGKLTGDAHPRVLLEFDTGRVLIGDGTAAPAGGIRHHANGTQISTNLVLPPTVDIGSGSQVPRHIRAGQGFVVPMYTTANRPTPPEDTAGALTIIDSTLNKTISYYKGEWRDADGNVV